MPSKNTKAKALKIINAHAREYVKDRNRFHLDKIQEIVDSVGRSIVIQIKDKDGGPPVHIKFFPHER
jgi:hypothetical protein